MTKSFEQLGREALKVWGKESQLDMVIEECAELRVAGVEDVTGVSSL